MPFDIQAARAAGYSDAEIADYLGKKSGFDVQGARKSGYQDAEIVSHLDAKQTAKAREDSWVGKFGDQIVDNVSSGIKSALGPIAGNLVQSGGKILRARSDSGEAAAISPLVSVMYNAAGIPLPETSATRQETSPLGVCT